MIKKALNISFLKSQQLMINIKFFNVYVLFLDIYSLKILNLKKKFKKKI